ncbi:Cell division protein DivIB [bacterium HR30]|nr:Cell division protein DivIB [bacterium HR30]
MLLFLGAATLVGVGRGVPELVERVRKHEYFRVRTLELEGNRRVSREQLLAWIGWEEDASVWDVDPKALQRRLAEHPWIHGATVQRILPRRIRIQVRERRPVAMVHVNGSFQYLDRLGRVLGPLLPGEAPDLPVISGIDEFVDGDLSSVHVHRALQLLRICDRLRCFDNISQVQIGRKGLVVVPVRPKVAIVLGWTGLEEKLRRSARVFAHWEGRMDELRLVDVSFPRVAVLKLAPSQQAPGRRARPRPGRTEA